jgi:hypothetical protein
MARRPQHWAIGGFILLTILVTAFVLVSLLLSRGIGLPATFLVQPGEVTLNSGEGWQFRAVAGDRLMPEVEWTASGGDIGPEGFYVAPDTPGDYQIVAHHPNLNYRAAATVHVVVPEGATVEQPSPTEEIGPLQPTSIPTTSPEATPVAPSPSPPAPTRTPIPTPVSTALSDGSGDLVDFDTLAPVAIAPPGADILSACFDEGHQLVRTIPAELADEIGDWNTEENLVLWLTFHEPIPTDPGGERYWIFALDTDRDTATGRPVGEGIINPDIGVEATIGVRSDPATGVELTPYAMIWNAGLGTSESQVLDLEARLSAARDALFVRVPAGSLAETIRTLSGVEPDWDRTVGRALTTATTSEGTVVDFCPERP